MFRCWRQCVLTKICYTPRRSFLTKDYKCLEAWNSQISSPLLSKLNLNDFYNIIDQNYSSKGVISAVDVDLFANAIRDPVYLEELKDLLHKLRLSAETMNTLESTNHATVRNFIEFGSVQELISILKDPLNFGVFLDDFTANILLDKLIGAQDYELAAEVAALVMLQEECNNEITKTLCQYACYKYILNYTPKVISPPTDEKKAKVDEIKIRIKYLRNPYYDDHFDIKDTYILSGKTLAWLSNNDDTLNNNLQLIGWLIYKKYDSLLAACKEITKSHSKNIYAEVVNLVKKELESKDDATTAILHECIGLLEGNSPAEGSLEEAQKIAIENSINKTHKQDILLQNKLFNSWVKLREEKLEEQTKRLDRAKRMQLIVEKQSKLKDEEQKLWFFENEENIDLQIEDKEKLVEKSNESKTTTKESDENYIPPEILPKKK